MIKYIKSGGGIANYNLQDEQVEWYSKDREYLYVLECTEDEFGVWSDAQEVSYEEIDLSAATSFILDSDQMKSYKPRLIEKIKKCASEKINALYPLYKQNNINELQGYTQSEKDAMWSYINEQREWSNTLEERVTSSISLRELNNIEKEI